MKFRNYCIVVMGETSDVLSEIIKVAESTPNVLDAKGILIATFSSVAEPKELTDYFKLNGRSFLIFDLDTENSGYHIVKDEINEGLFGFLKFMNDEGLKEKTDKLIREISATTVTSQNHKTKKTSQVGVTLEDVEGLTPKERNDLMDKLIDLGIENLSSYDKKLLDKLAI